MQKEEGYAKLGRKSKRQLIKMVISLREENKILKKWLLGEYYTGNVLEEKAKSEG